jgi:tetratricopeptide (TPR) repeat protein
LRMEKLKENLTKKEGFTKSFAGLANRTSNNKVPKAVIVSVFIVVAMFIIGGNLGPDRRTTQAAIDIGVQAHLAGDYQKARAHYLYALEREPENKFAHYNLGLLAQIAGNRGESEARYNEALKIDEFFMPAMYNLAVLKENVGENESAAALYRQIIESHPQQAAPHYRLGVVLGFKLSRPDEARAEILKAAELDPRIAQALKGVAKPQPPQKQE